MFKSLRGPEKKKISYSGRSHVGETMQLEGDLRTSGAIDVAGLVNAGYPDIRRVINSTQRQVVDGMLVVDKQSLVESDYKMKLLEIIKKENRKDAFKSVRKLLADSQVTDFAELYKLMYDEVDSYGTGHIAECILIVAKYQLSDSQVVDKEINAMAMIIELLGVIK